jgi:hypothetical protein
MKGFDSWISHNMRTSEELSNNKPFNNQTIMKDFVFLFVLAFSLFSLWELETMWSLFQVH